eukprot:10757139-Alexandrium_andersonii.AAC.1
MPTGSVRKIMVALTTTPESRNELVFPFRARRVCHTEQCPRTRSLLNQHTVFDSVTRDGRKSLSDIQELHRTQA